MKKIYIWGAGGNADFIYSIVNKKEFKIEGIIDNDVSKQGKLWKYGLTVYPPSHLVQGFFDYILISPQKYNAIEDECYKLGISEEKIVIYFRDVECEGIFENRGIFIKKLLAEKKRNQIRYENAPYEWGVKRVPIIKSGIELLQKIEKTGCSLCRYGDGEFELMLQRERPWFQKVDQVLADRLRKIIQEDESDIVVAIADDFGSLEIYEETFADAIRDYMSGTTREDIMQFIDLEREYYDAYVTRPYLMRKDKNYAEEVFTLFKKIWNQRDVILVEGQYARIGIGNDLLNNAKSIRRILAPAKDAWNKYDEILEYVCAVANSNDLICISLGPTATIMAYDLAKRGLQALDIGQLDNEYDWFLRGVTQRIPIPGKMVAEVKEKYVAVDVTDKVYEEQIINVMY